MPDLVTRETEKPLATEDSSRLPVPVTPEPPSPPEDEGGVMTLREHLIELRDRIFKAVLGVLAGSVAGFFLAGPVLRYFAEQICAEQGGGQDCRLQIIEPTEGLVTYFKVAVYIGVALGLPVIIYQLVRFMSPGLTRAERRMLYVALPFVSLLFVAGAFFAVGVVLPAMLKFLGGFMPELFLAEFRASATLNLALTVTLWMGLVFEMPLVMFVLTWFGVVTARLFLSWWRYAIVFILIASAIITPTPDPINMMIVAVPMIVLYLFGILLARFAEGMMRRAPVKAAAA